MVKLKQLKVIICALLLAVIFQVPTLSIASEQVVDGPIARQHLQRTVLKMLYREKFDDLEKMSGEFRKTKARFPDGVWKLEFFYNGLSSPFEKSADGWKRYLAKMDKWMQKSPDSITAKVAAGEAWISFGMYARGGGYADSVSDEGWRLLAERIQKAYSLLAAKPSNRADDCPVRYDYLLSLAKTQGLPRPQFEALFQEAITFEPAYFSYYQRKVEYLQPRWHGEEGEWQQFAQEILKLDPEKEGKTLYTRAFLWPLWKYKKFTSFNAPGVSWPLMKQGFIDAEKSFPGSPWLLNNFCKSACIAGDKETARELFRRIDNHPYLEAWDDRDGFEKWREWAFPSEKRDDKSRQQKPYGESEDRRQMLKLAEEGDMEAQYQVGRLYESWPHGAPDNAKARKWYEKAAEQGHPEAQFNVGRFISSGTSSSKLTESAKWDSMAAMQSSEQAAVAMGNKYKLGVGVEKDLVKAFAWFSQITSRNDPNVKEIAVKFTKEEMKLAELETSKLRDEIQLNKIAAESK